MRFEEAPQQSLPGGFIQFTEDTPHDLWADMVDAVSKREAEFVVYGTRPDASHITPGFALSTADASPVVAAGLGVAWSGRRTFDLWSAGWSVLDPRGHGQYYTADYSYSATDTLENAIPLTNVEKRWVGSPLSQAWTLNAAAASRLVDSVDVLINQASVECSWRYARTGRLEAGRTVDLIGDPKLLVDSRLGGEWSYNGRPTLAADITSHVRDASGRIERVIGRGPDGTAVAIATVTGAAADRVHPGGIGNQITKVIDLTAVDDATQRQQLVDAALARFKQSAGPRVSFGLSVPPGSYSVGRDLRAGDRILVHDEHLVIEDPTADAIDTPAGRIRPLECVVTRMSYSPPPGSGVWYFRIGIPVQDVTDYVVPGDGSARLSVSSDLSPVSDSVASFGAVDAPVSRVRTDVPMRPIETVTSTAPNGRAVTTTTGQGMSVTSVGSIGLAKAY